MIYCLKLMKNREPLNEAELISIGVYSYFHKEDLVVKACLGN